MGGRLISRPLYLCIAVLYGLYLGLNALIGLPPHTDIEVWEPLTWELSSVLVVFALLPLVVRLEQRVPIDSRPRGRVIAVHSMAAVLFSVFHTSLMVLIRVVVYAAAGKRYGIDHYALRLFYEGQKDLVTYLIVLAAIFAYRQFRIRRSSELHAAKLSADLSQAQLRHLTTQIEPHFLFNALNAISNRLHEDVDAADRMIAELGSLLRAAYDTGNDVLVPLDAELAWLRAYAAMMTERFRGRLVFKLDADPTLSDIQVPRLLLQPLVENALRHGLASGDGVLTVQVRRVGNELTYSVSDDGVGVTDPVAALDSGTGLSNVRRRLELIYPGRHHFALAPREPRGTVVTLQFPCAA